MPPPPNDQNQHNHSPTVTITPEGARVFKPITVARRIFPL